MLRATYLFVFGVIITFATLAFSQETSIEKAQKISRRSGKPIFAIASKKICGPCNILKSRVSQLFQNKNIADKVVYLKVDLNDSSWATWSRKFPHQGRMLPVVYLIRADGKQMYGQSNTLPGDQLQKFIDQGVAHCGDSLSQEQIDSLVKTNSSLSEAIDADDLVTAAKEIENVKPIGTPGELKSFAEAAIANNRLVKDLATKSVSFVNSELKEIEEELQGDENAQFNGAFRFVQLQDTFGAIGELKDEFSKIAIKLAVDKNLRQTWSLSNKIYIASRTLNSTAPTNQKSVAEQSLTEIESGVAPSAAKLAAKKIKQTHASILASLEVDSKSK